MAPVMKTFNVFLTVIASGSANLTEQPTVPTLCTAEIQGRCDCGNLHNRSDLRTYTWWINSEQRCYTIHKSKDARKNPSNEKVPVVMYLNCYGKDNVENNTGLTGYMANADRFGTYLVYASSPRGSWSWRSAISNDTQPSTCDSIQGGDDFTYFEDIFAHLPTVIPDHDPEQVFTFGFSQNGMGAGYVGSCFQHKVTGAWRAGAGLFLKDGSGGPVPPNKEGNCSTCAYWPTYPCFQGVGKLPLRDCAMDYDNDPLTAFNSTDNHPMGLYRKSLLEGGDARVLVFRSEVDPPGRHRPPLYDFDWAMGCMGLRNKAGQCGSECVRALKVCVSGGSDYGKCMGISAKSPDHDVARFCSDGCTPTWEMLTQSQIPFLHTTNMGVYGFGAPSIEVCKESKPTTSICTVDPSRVKPCPARTFFV